MLWLFPPHFGSHTFKEIFVRLLAACRDNRIEVLVAIPNKEYTLCRKNLEKSQTNKPSPQNSAIPEE